MKIKDLPIDIQEYLFYELSCQHSEYTLDSEILDVLDTENTEDGNEFWININSGNFIVFFDRHKYLNANIGMKIKDLKTGMCVVLYSGEVGIVFKDAFINNETISGIALQEGGVLLLKDYDNNLMFRKPLDNTIVFNFSIDEVYSFATLYYALERNTRLGKRIWKRHTPEYTLEELYNKIGHKFIIK